MFYLPIKKCVVPELYTQLTKFTSVPKTVVGEICVPLMKQPEEMHAAPVPAVTLDLTMTLLPLFSPLFETFTPAGIISWAREGARLPLSFPPYPVPGWAMRCPPWSWRLGPSLCMCKSSWALNPGRRRCYGGWGSAKIWQCGFYMLQHAAPEFCIAAFWSCSSANLELCSNPKCVQNVVFRSAVLLECC